MENEKINKRILKIWENYSNESGKYHPILYPNFNRDGILFIGFNPSFNETSFKKILNGTKYQNIDIEEKLNRNNRDNRIFDFLIWEQNRANSICNYFDKFHEISKFINLPYQHIDLFYSRQTNQNKAKKKIGKYDKNEKFILNEFGLDQLKIAIEMIAEINPKVIVIANAFASDIINNCDLFKITQEKFEKVGYDILEINNEKIPILFSSMLTGQRALDKHSLRRLKWQIKTIIK